MVHILVADDEEQLRNIIRIVLRSAGYQVDLASNGTEALRLIMAKLDKGEEYDLLITDIQMPEMNGLELLNEVKDLNLSTEVLAMTGFGDKKMVVDLLRKGCSGYIDKPFNDDDIIETIRSLLEKREKEIHKQEKLTERFNNKYRSLMNHVNEAKRSYEDLINSDLSKIPAKICVKNRPKDELGGDFYGFNCVKGGFVMLVADVSGHDMGASYYTVLLKAFFEEYCTHFDGDVSNFFVILNQALSTTGMARMITAQIVFWDLRTGRVSFQNAGHPPAFKISRDRNSVEKIVHDQPVLGLVDDAVYESMSFPFTEGERFIFFTDGLTDLCQIDGESGVKSVLSIDGIEHQIISSSAQPLEIMIEQIWSDSLKFARYKTNDDVLLIGIEIGGNHV